jgi:hypothetical protein
MSDVLYEYESFIILAIAVVISILSVVVMWRVYARANEPGWAVLIPVYNVYISLRIAGMSGWLIFLMLIPGVNVIITFFMMLRHAEYFGRGTFFGLGLFFLPEIFYPILAFSREPQQAMPEERILLTLK